MGTEVCYVVTSNLLIDQGILSDREKVKFTYTLSIDLPSILQTSLLCLIKLNTVKIVARNVHAGVVFNFCVSWITENLEIWVCLKPCYFGLLKTLTTPLDFRWCGNQFHAGRLPCQREFLLWNWIKHLFRTWWVYASHQAWSVNPPAWKLRVKL